MYPVYDGSQIRLKFMGNFADRKAPIAKRRKINDLMFSARHPRQAFGLDQPSFFAESFASSSSRWEVSPDRQELPPLSLLLSLAFDWNADFFPANPVLMAALASAR